MLEWIYNVMWDIIFPIIGLLGICGIILLLIAVKNAKQYNDVDEPPL